MLKPLCLGAVFSLSGLAPVSAQTTNVYVDVGPCLAMETDTERYSCYVVLAEKARSTRAENADFTESSIPVAAREGHEYLNEVAEKSAVNHALKEADEFGLETPAAAAHEIANARILANDNGEQELVVTIAKLDERMPNMWDVTLANDQVWRQINSDVYRLQEGMEVRIYPSPFAGSFRMSAKGKNGFIQVRRIR